ncbi:MAG TPA: ActS/PrrB/RegB family redox-sensitive histidine kinase [Caulobacteraceae bacterium]|nr:ActS/PrrB/RegB family redox-sensitive histidine kinase [Caulobacteraceae bacterium]
MNRHDPFRSAPSRGASAFDPSDASGKDPHPRERLRPRTLILLRWLAIGGQLAALVVVRFALGFDFPVLQCLALIALSAAVNLALVLGVPPQRVSHQWETAAQLIFDTLQLGGLLFLTGGADNPFDILLIGPAVLSAMTLQARFTVMVGGIAILVGLTLSVAYLPLPWHPGEVLETPLLYRLGEGAAVTMGVVLTSAYAWGSAAESSRMEHALHAAETVLHREQQLSALGALAAATAHELGTPLATIAVVAKEMALAIPEGALREDAELVSSQAKRCREILRRMAEQPEASDMVHARISLAQLLEQAVEPHADDGRVRMEWSVIGPPGAEPPDLLRLPEVSRALTSFVDNAVDFARSEVRVIGRFDDDVVVIEVRDDGPGFSPDIFAKLGEPYITSRPTGEGSPSGHLGMGLGFFIAKTLLERTGGQMEFHNDRAGGAVIAIRWAREDIEAPPAF